MNITKDNVIKAMKNCKYSYSSSQFKELKDLKEKQISNALRYICPNNGRAVVIGIFDETMFGSGKNGFAVTKDTLYFSKKYYVVGDKSKNWVALDNMSSVTRKVNGSEVGIVHPDESVEWFYCGIFQKDIFDFLGLLIKYTKETVKKEKTEKHNSDEFCFHKYELFSSMDLENTASGTVVAAEEAAKKKAAEEAAKKKAAEEAAKKKAVEKIDRIPFASSVLKNSNASLEQLMEAEFQMRREVVEKNNRTAIDVLEKLQYRLACMLINSTNYVTTDYYGVELPTRYLAYRYATRQNDGEVLGIAAYNLATEYFRKDDDDYMCGVDEAAALLQIADHQFKKLLNEIDRNVNSAHKACDSFYYACKQAKKRDYNDPPSRGKSKKREEMLERMAWRHPFAAYQRALYYNDYAKTDEELWRAEQLAVYAVSAEYVPLHPGQFGKIERPLEYTYFPVTVDLKSPETLLQEIREQLKKKGLPSKYDMTEQWKAYHNILVKANTLETKNQKNNYEVARDTFLLAGEKLEKLEKARKMAEDLRRVDGNNQNQDRESQHLLNKIEAKINYVKGKQELERGNYTLACQHLDSLRADDRTEDAMYYLAIAYLCDDNMMDKSDLSNIKYAIRGSGRKELLSLLQYLDAYYEAIDYYGRKDPRAESKLDTVKYMIDEANPYPHPYYLTAKFYLEKAKSSSWMGMDSSNKRRLLIAAKVSCMNGMAQIDKTTWLPQTARRKLHSKFKSLYQDIQSRL